MWRLKRREGGQAILPVMMGLGIFLLGAIGLAVDGGHLYAQRQMAQSAADAAAQAAIMSVFYGTNTVTANTHKFTVPSSQPTSPNCGTSGAATPCYFAQTVNGFNLAGDSVSYWNPGITVSNLSTTDTPSEVEVQVSRKVNTTFMGMLGSSGSTITASGVAAIIAKISPTPLMITHPTLSGSLSGNGTTNVTITGGPPQSVEVDSSSSTALASGGSYTVSGTFGVFGNEANPGNVSPTANYKSPSPPIWVSIAPPSAPSPANNQGSGGQACSVLGHCSSCPNGSSCKEFLPGTYASGLDTTGNDALFDPGLYYITSSGFKVKNSNIKMCPVPSICASDTNTAGGMLVYDTGSASGGCDVTGGFDIDTNTNHSTFNPLYGAGVNQASTSSAPTGPYFGLLFFEDQNACAHTGNGQTSSGGSHVLGQGNSCFQLVGTIFITNTLQIMTANASQYQDVQYNGGTCTGVNLYGEMIVSALSIVGNSAVTMNLFSQSLFKIRQVALVQ